MKEYKIIFDRRPIGTMFIDENGYFHLYVRENGHEYISNDILDIDQLTDVLLDEGSDPKFVRIPVRYSSVPENDKERDLAISAYSKSGVLKARMYVHDVVEKELISYMNIDSFIIRTLRELPGSTSHEPVKAPEYTIAERLRYFRKRARLSGYELAKLAGVSITTTNGIERGRVMNPSYFSLKAICDVLEITLAEFFSINIENEQELNISLMEEIKYLTSEEQAALSRTLRNRRLSNSDSE